MWKRGEVTTAKPVERVEVTTPRLVQHGAGGKTLRPVQYLLYVERAGVTTVQPKEYISLSVGRTLPTPLRLLCYTDGHWTGSAV